MWDETSPGLPAAPASTKAIWSRPLKVCDSQITAARSRTSLIMRPQNRTVTELIRDVFQGTTVHVKLCEAEAP